MAEMTYDNFDISILRAHDGYRVVVRSEGGEPEMPFRLLFAEEDLALFRESINQPLRDAHREQLEQSRLKAPNPDIIKNIGEQLFDSLFHGKVGTSLVVSLDKARSKEKQLRIRLNLRDVPELATLPWEYLYSRARQQYLALSRETPIVRYLPLDESSKPLRVKPPLKVLVMISDPNDYPRLQVEKEWNMLCEALAPLRLAKQVEVDRLPNATFDALQDQMMTNKHHVFHFVGHGDFDKERSEGVLIWEGLKGEGQVVRQEYLRVALDSPALRLVILNSCSGAQTGPRDPFAGVAQSLVQLSIPAVIAMQCKITDNAAIQFAGRFYRALTAGLPIDAALAAARTAMFFVGSPVEWGIPALYMRSPDGFIFEIDHLTEEERRQAKIDALRRTAIASVENKDYASAVKHLQEIMQFSQQQR